MHCLRDENQNAYPHLTHPRQRIPAHHQRTDKPNQPILLHLQAHPVANNPLQLHPRSLILPPLQLPVLPFFAQPHQHSPQLLHRE